MSNGTVRTRVGDLLGLGAFVALCLAISAIGGWATAGSVGTWYRTLQRPEFNPPDWVFAPVWTLLYLMIALAEIVLLLAVIGVNVALFWRTDRLAGWLLVPYAAWVAFACVLNFAL